MAGWILGVSKDQSDNWRIGRDAGVWAIPRFRPIRAGGDLFFWLSRSGIIAHGRAVTDATVPEDYESLPWPDRYREDPRGAASRRYSHWFVMQVLKELVVARNQKWSDMAIELGFRAQANSMPVEIPAEGDQIALSWFDPNQPSVELQAPTETTNTSEALAATVPFVDLRTDRRVAISADPAVLDPDVLGDSLNRHSHAVNLLAAMVRLQGWEPELMSSWFGEKPDLIWIDGDEVLNVAEVKGITTNNELSQMRIGLGQVLRYRYRAAAAYGRAIAWLVTDSTALDDLWDSICDSLGVRLWWPGR